MIIRLKRKIAIGALLLSSSIVASPALAGMNDFWDHTVNVESSGNWNVQTQICSSCTAYGGYQMILDHWITYGVVEPGATSWDNAQFTEYAASYGVYSRDDLGLTDRGRELQGIVANQLAQSEWNRLNSTTKSYVGQTINGVTINEAALLGTSWFLGAGGMNQWAAGGFSVDALRALDADGSILRSNRMGSYEELQQYLLNRMASYGDIDISDLTNGTFVQGGGRPTGVVGECDPVIKQALQQQGQAMVQNAVNLAQDDYLGFSKLQQPFGELSCIEGFFAGGLDIHFQVPSIDQIVGQLKQAACNQINAKIQEVQSQVTSKLGELAGASSLQIPGFGPIQSLGGVQFNFNNSGQVTFSTGPGSGGGGMGGGFGGGGFGGGGSGVGYSSSSDGLNVLFRR